MSNGDGLLLTGKTLYVVQNQLNRIAVVALGKNLTSGRVTRTITNPASTCRRRSIDMGSASTRSTPASARPAGPSTTYSVVLAQG